jgi:hypothetical protein
MNPRRFLPLASHVWSALATLAIALLLSLSFAQSLGLGAL